MPTQQEIDAMKPADRNWGQSAMDWVFNAGKDNAQYDKQKAEYEKALREYEAAEKAKRDAALMAGILGTGQKPTNYYEGMSTWSDAAATQRQSSRDMFGRALQGTYQPTQEQSAQTREQQAAGASQAYQNYLTGGQQAQQLAQQQQYAQYLQGIIQGTGAPSVAQGQLRLQSDAAQRQAAAAIASQRGMNTAGAARMIAQEQAQQGQAAAGQAAMLTAQEQAAARQQYGELLGQTRGQSIEAESRQAAAFSQMQEALRTGDQNAINSVMNSLNNLSQIDMSMLSLEQQAVLQREQAALQQKIEEAKMLLQNKIAEIEANLAQQKIDADTAQREKDFWTKIIMNGILAAGSAALFLVPGIGTALGGAGMGAAVAGIAGAMGNNKAKGGRIDKARVPGKSKHNGDDERNDTVPALLSPGEIVIPRSIATSKDADQKSAEFVKQLMKKEKSGPKSKRSAIDEISKLEAKIAALKSKAKRE